MVKIFLYINAYTIEMSMMLRKPSDRELKYLPSNLMLTENKRCAELLNLKQYSIILVKLNFSEQNWAFIKLYNFYSSFGMCWMIYNKLISECGITLALICSLRIQRVSSRLNRFEWMEGEWSERDVRND